MLDCNCDEKEYKKKKQAEEEERFALQKKDPRPWVVLDIDHFLLLDFDDSSNLLHRWKFYKVNQGKEHLQVPAWAFVITALLGLGCRIAFFSSGADSRNQMILQQLMERIRLLCKDMDLTGQLHILSREEMTPKNHFKPSSRCKNLMKVCGDVTNTLLFDDQDNVQPRKNGVIVADSELMKLSITFFLDQYLQEEEKKSPQDAHVYFIHQFFTLGVVLDSLQYQKEHQTSFAESFHALKCEEYQRDIPKNWESLVMKGLAKLKEFNLVPFDGNHELKKIFVPDSKLLSDDNDVKTRLEYYKKKPADASEDDLFPDYHNEMIRDPNAAELIKWLVKQGKYVSKSKKLVWFSE